jgi:cytochrome b561
LAAHGPDHRHVAAGFFVLAAMPNSDPQKIRVLLVHMAAGMTILALMVVRFIVRMLTSRPAPAPAIEASTGSRRSRISAFTSWSC